MSDILNCFTAVNVFNIPEYGYGKVEIDISKRAYDRKFIIWQKMFSFFVDGSKPNIENDIGSIKYQEFWKRNYKHLWHVVWVPVKIAYNKSKATQYCRDRFGENCFQENDSVKITPAEYAENNLQVTKNCRP